MIVLCLEFAYSSLNRPQKCANLVTLVLRKELHVGFSLSLLKDNPFRTGNLFVSNILDDITI